MPLHQYINDPVAHEIIHNGATFQTVSNRLAKRDANSKYVVYSVFSERNMLQRTNASRPPIMRSRRIAMQISVVSLHDANLRYADDDGETVRSSLPPPLPLLLPPPLHTPARERARSCVRHGRRRRLRLLPPPAGFLRRRSWGPVPAPHGRQPLLARDSRRPVPSTPLSRRGRRLLGLGRCCWHGS